MQFVEEAKQRLSETKAQLGESLAALRYESRALRLSFFVLTQSLQVGLYQLQAAVIATLQRQLLELQVRHRELSASRVDSLTAPTEEAYKAAVAEVDAKVKGSWLFIRHSTLRVAARVMYPGINLPEMEFYGNGKYFELVSADFKVAFIAVGTLSLVGLSVWTGYEWSLIPSSKQTAPSEQKASPELDRSHGFVDVPVVGDQRPSAPTDQPVNRAHEAKTRVTTIIPADDIPVTWTRGSHTELTRGIDKSDFDLKSQLAKVTACDTEAIVIFGTASAEGGDDNNMKLARDRALEVASKLMAARRQCTDDHAMAVQLIALSSPANLSADGFQRRLCVLTWQDKRPASLVVTEMESTPLLLFADATRCVDLAAYQRRDFCVLSEDQTSCENWRPYPISEFEPAIPR
jgi:hypothetical protein